MNVGEIQQRVLELPEAERHRFAKWFYQNLRRIAPSLADDAGDEELSDALKVELSLRRQEYVEHPERFVRFASEAEMREWFLRRAATS
jgi:hypothetical protein